jgi:hypothetical protein
MTKTWELIHGVGVGHSLGVETRINTESFREVLGVENPILGHRIWPHDSHHVGRLIMTKKGESE